MGKKETVKVEGEEVDKELMERFDTAVRNIEENDNRHIVPDFLKQGIDPVKEYKKFRKELKSEVSIFGHNKKKKSKASKA